MFYLIKHIESKSKYVLFKLAYKARRIVSLCTLFSYLYNPLRNVENLRRDGEKLNN